MSTNRSDLSTLTKRLAKYRDYIQVDPLSNPVRQIAHEVSVTLEAKTDPLDVAELAAIVKQLSDEAFLDRAARLRSYLQLDDTDQLTMLASAAVDACESFEELTTRWGKQRDMVVFTAHPTFLMSKQMRELLGDIACSDKPTKAQTAELTSLAHAPDKPLTLPYEHDAVLDAIDHASDAVSRFHGSLIKAAKDKFPAEWQNFVPRSLCTASWVGYDMDGRNDIGWHDVIRHRLIEKHRRLSWYRHRATNISGAAELVARLEASETHTAKAVALFTGDMDDPKSFTLAANFLSDDAPEKITDLEEIDDLIKKLLKQSEGKTALAVASLRADMASFGLGAGEVHFRLNANQIRNAARDALKLENDVDLFSRSVLDEVQKLIEGVEPVDVNFAALALEKASASRLFIAMAQFVKHIDATQPIRLLIAECENPVTVLSALYIARKFGVEKHVDICPLFETGDALDRARRILDVLFQQTTYQKYVNQRGRVAIQAGFSDAGRFMGQIPAGLAIERLQGHLAGYMEKNGLGHLDAIIFNTHGESMGRGHDQRSIMDRQLYALSPWARRQFSDRNIDLIHETSFQGGDGYLLFSNAQMSSASLAGILSAHLAAAKSPRQDLFYEDISTSLDFYRTVKKSQEDLFADQAYHTTLTTIGLALLPVTGSRKAKRQFERRTDEDASLRKIRAIPHNAILQQMGYLANIVGGVGGALAVEPTYFSQLEETSERFSRLMSLVAKARKLSEMKVLIAYMKLFDGSFWATRPLSGQEDHLEKPCADLANRLAKDNRYFSALQLAARLRSDSIALDKSLTKMGLLPDFNGTPPPLDMLHAIRIALIQHLFILAATLPRFSPQAGISREDVMELIFHLEVPQAVSLLRQTFPIDAPKVTDFKLKEKATYPSSNAPIYEQIHQDFIEPLRETHKQIQLITTGIAHYYNAVG